MLTFERASRIINDTNRFADVSSILAAIAQLAKEMPQYPVQGWTELQSLAETLKSLRGRGLREVAPWIRRVKATALAMMTPMHLALQEPDLFTEPGFVEPELEPVMAARKAPKVPSQICDRALDYRPTTSNAIKESLQRYYRSGIEGLGWYDNVRDILTRYFGEENARTFAKLLSATSPRTPVERNLATAIRAFNQYVNEFRRATGARGEVSLGDDPEFKATMRSHVPNIGRAMSGADLRGSKVENFERALWGDPDAVTLDVWMGRAFGARSKTPFSKPAFYEIMADAIRDLAAQEGVEPRQYQAAVWTGVKNELGRKGDTSSSFDALMGKFWESFARKCFKPNVKTPKVPTKYPLFEQASAWIRANCKFARRPYRQERQN